MLIITCTDDNYMPGVLVLIASAAYHNPQASFAVLNMGLEPKNRERIDRLGAKLGVAIQQVQVDASRFDGITVRRAHLTRSCYMRLLIPEYFPDIDRAIYLDCDMVVMDTLQELQRFELGEAPIAAVACPSPDPAELAATGHVLGSYVNSGLLVMNLPVWRKEGLTDQCLAPLSAPERPFVCEDQSAINLVCRGRVRFLPSRFNVYASFASYEDLQILPRDPAILHFVVGNKPWKRTTIMEEIWHFHANRIAELMPPMTIYRRRLSMLNQRRKLILGSLMRREKYLVRRNVERAWQGIARRYLNAHSGTRLAIPFRKANRAGYPPSPSNSTVDR